MAATATDRIIPIHETESVRTLTLRRAEVLGQVDQLRAERAEAARRTQASYDLRCAAAIAAGLPEPDRDDGRTLDEFDRRIGVLNDAAGKLYEAIRAAERDESRRVMERLRPRRLELLTAQLRALEALDAACREQDRFRRDLELMGVRGIGWEEFPRLREHPIARAIEEVTAAIADA